MKNLYEKIFGKRISITSEFSIFIKYFESDIYGFNNSQPKNIAPSLIRFELNAQRDELNEPARCFIEKVRERGHEITPLPGDVAGHFAYPII